MTAISKESIIQRSCHPVWGDILKTTAFPSLEYIPFEGWE